LYVSIHAPARGATYLNLTKMRKRYSFNPRPCARGDSIYAVLLITVVACFAYTSLIEHFVALKLLSISIVVSHLLP